MRGIFESIQKYSSIREKGSGFMSRKLVKRGFAEGHNHVSANLCLEEKSRPRKW